MCYFVPYIELAVTHTSVLTILAITVERYYAICLPLQVGSIFLMRFFSAKKRGLGCVKMTSLEHRITQPRANHLLSVMQCNFSSGEHRVDQDEGVPDVSGGVAVRLRSDGAHHLHHDVHARPGHAGLPHLGEQG